MHSSLAAPARCLASQGESGGREPLPPAQSRAAGGCSPLGSAGNCRKPQEALLPNCPCTSARG
eukprot:4386062-Alexandrium_andersonii.AAC.1